MVGRVVATLLLTSKNMAPRHFRRRSRHPPARSLMQTSRASGTMDMAARAATDAVAVQEAGAGSGCQKDVARQGRKQ